MFASKISFFRRGSRNLLYAVMVLALVALFFLVNHQVDEGPLPHGQQLKLEQVPRRPPPLEPGKIPPAVRKAPTPPPKPTAKPPVTVKQTTARPTTTSKKPTTVMKPTTVKKPTTVMMKPTTAAAKPAAPVDPRSLIPDAKFKRPLPPIRRPYNFDGFNNVTGLQTGDYLVPNIVHFLRFGKEKAEIGFVDFVVILAAFKNQRPDRIIFHSDSHNFTGRYWEKLLSAPGFADCVEMVFMELPKEVFGVKFSEGWRIWHAADVVRIRVMMKYGGIILDTDSYLVRSLDKYRRFEIAIGWDDNKFIGCQVIVAHPDARFLKEYHETYRVYKSNLWYYNAGERPTVEVLYKRPELVHRVKLLFGVHHLVSVLYRNNDVWEEWRDQYAIHLLIRHQGKHFDESNFMKPPTTFRDMVLDVYDPYTQLPRVV